MWTKPTTRWIAAACVIARRGAYSMSVGGAFGKSECAVAHRQWPMRARRAAAWRPEALRRSRSNEAASREGYAVLKDLNGASQFLLIPTQRVDGIESPALLAPDAANFFDDAWTARSFAKRRSATRCNAIRSAWPSIRSSARTQNQLHIHIDCIRADVRDILRSESEHIGDALDVADTAARRSSLPRACASWGRRSTDITRSSCWRRAFRVRAPRWRRAYAGRRGGMRFAHRTPGFVVLDDRADLTRGDIVEAERNYKTTPVR